MAVIAVLGETLEPLPHKEIPALLRVKCARLNRAGTVLTAQGVVSLCVGVPRVKSKCINNHRDLKGSPVQISKTKQAGTSNCCTAVPP